MDKSIYFLQNQDIILGALVTQGKLYSKAKRMNCFSFLFCVVVPIIYSISKGFLSGDYLLIFGAVLTVGGIFIPDMLSRCVSKTQSIAAKIQQTIDILLFKNDIYENDWGECYTETELLSLVHEAKIIEEEKRKKKNWYNNYSKFPHTTQVYYCQCENVRWDKDLRKTFLTTLKACLLVIIVLSFTISAYLKMTITEILYVIILLTPFIKWCIPIKRKIYSDCDRLDNIFEKQTTIQHQCELTKESKELYIKAIELQGLIYIHRKSGLLIPDFFYKLFRNKQQNKEDFISSSIN